MMNNNAFEVRNRFENIRKTYGMSQREFAKKLGYTSQLISMIETGKANVSYHNARLIQEVFGINLDWLLNGIGPKMVREPDYKEEVSDDYLSCFSAIRDYVNYLMGKMKVEELYELNKLCKRILKKQITNNNNNNI